MTLKEKAQNIIDLAETPSKIRRCLKCGQKFKSRNYGNRFCSLHKPSYTGGILGINMPRGY